MSWTRLDDRWTEQPTFEVLSYPARWHYLALIQACSRTDRLDGRLSSSAARRASDVPDPTAVLTELAAAGLVESTETGIRVPAIADHVPPPSVRQNSEQSRERMRRMRAHKAGEHSLCLPENCQGAPQPVTDDVTSNSRTPEPVTVEVTRNTGTGRDRPGQAGQRSEARLGSGDDSWPPLLLCEVCGSPMSPELALAESWTSHPSCDRGVG